MSDQQSSKAFTDRLRDHADSSSDNLEPIELLADDFMRRKRAGENPTIEEYCSDHPELADEIREVFPALVVIERVAPDSADLDESANTLRSSDLQAIESIGDYRVLREIGRGGMGVVYEAEQESLGRRVALKVLPRHVADDEKALLRFQREARAAAKMHHTNIVPVFDVGKDKEYSFYAMQLIKGQGLDHVIGDLRELRSQVTGKPYPDAGARRDDIEKRLAASLINGHFEQQNLLDSGDAQERDRSSDAIDSKELALTETMIQSAGSTVSATLPGQSEVSSAESNRAAYFHSVAEIGLQASRALAYAHARGITHRDIKPSNLILDTAGVVWITDFGLARTGDSSMTGTGDILGTIRYMSPERFKGQCDNRADVYSLGLTLYELLVLKPAFLSPDRLKLIDIVTKTEVTAPRSIDSRIPRDLETIVLKACDKEPRHRYQSADEMADDIQRFVSDEPILARRASPTERVARWSRRNPWLATAMCVSAVALFAITGISMLAAQTQSELNEQLTEANDEQQQLNVELTTKTQEQRKTNQALVESNKSKEELIRDLKRSQSRLAEKQAEFVKEKGNLAESMLWLARSYELADGQKPEFRQNLLTKLEASAARMPKLRHVEGSREISRPLFAEQMSERLQRADTNEERREILQDALFSGQLLVNQATAVLSLDQTLLAIPKVVPSESKKFSDSNVAILVWGIDSASWVSRTIQTELRVSKLAIHSGRRLVAAISWKADEVVANKGEEADNSETQTSRSIPAPLGSLILNVWSIDSGKRLLKKVVASNLQLSAARGLSKFHFRSGGTEIVRISANSSTRGVTTKVHSVETGEVVHQADFPLVTQGSPISLLSPSGRRLITLISQRSPGSARRATLTCHDIESGEQVGQTIETSFSTINRTIERPTILTPDGTRIALLSGMGRDQRIEVLDFETGGQIGGAIDIPRASSSSVAILNANPSGSQLAVSIFTALAPRGQELGPNFVQVFDVETGNAIAPSVPTAGVANLVAMPDGTTTWSISNSTQIRTWQLPDSKVHRVLIPWQGMSAQRSAPFNRGNNGLPQFMQRTSLALQVAQGSHATSSTLNSRIINAPAIELAVNQSGNVLVAEKDETGIALRTWDLETGRLISQQKLPGTESSFVGMFSAGGGYLMTGHVGKGRDAAAYIELWRTSTATRKGEPFEVAREKIFDTLPLSVSPDGTSVLLRRRESSGRPAGLSAETTAGQRRFGGGNGFGGRGRFQFRLTVVNLKTGEETMLHPPMLQVAGRFSADGRFVLIESPGKRWRYDLKTGTLDPPFEAAETSSVLIGPNRTFGSRGGFGPGSFGGRGRFTQPQLAAWSTDGMLVAMIAADSVVQIRSVGENNQIGREEDRMVELPHSSQVVRVEFDPKSKFVVTAAADGLIRQWSLPKRWTGDADQIHQRVQRHTGIALADSDEVVLAKFEENSGSDDGQQTGPEFATSLASDHLTKHDRDALRFRNEGSWQEAEAAFAKWASLRPDDWQPQMLRIRPLVKLKKFNEADDAWDEAKRRIDHDAAFVWLKNDFDAQVNALNAQSVTNGAKYNRIDTDTAAITGWYQRRMLEFATDDVTKADLLFQLAKIHEVELHLEQAAVCINEAAKLSPDSNDIQYYRSHLMERLNRWNEALVSRQTMVRLDPEHHLHQYGLATHHLHQEKLDAFWKVWHASVEKYRDTDDPRIPGRTAKLRLLVDAPGHDLDLALRLADQSFENRSGLLADFDVLGKGIAEYRRENLNESLDYFRNVADGFEMNERFSDNVAMCQYFAAMVLHKLGDTEAAESAFLDALDRQHAYAAKLRQSNAATWVDWQQTEVVRREAKRVLNIDSRAIDLPVPDTSDWTVLLEDNFDDAISEDWQQMTGEWTVVDGAACGTLKRPTGATVDAYDRLECEIPNLPDTFEITYETWTSDPMMAACFLRLPSEFPVPLGHRIALCSFPDRDLVTRGKTGTGISLLTYASFNGGAVWFPETIPDVTVKPGHRYKVRIIRQPERISVSVDGQQVLSTRVRNIETRSIRFFARGE